MKSPLLLFVLILCYYGGISQIKFEKAYFVTTDGKKVDCLIRNVDWSRNPKTFDYKLTENSEVQTAGIDTVSEFSIINSSKYKRLNVAMDRSSNSIAMLSPNFAPELNKEQLFLKTLVEGNATLYSYEETNLKRFFYSLNDNDAVQLIYKRYLASENVVAENNTFRQQLLMGVQCLKNPLTVEQLGYNERSLTKYFTNYNDCENATVVNYGEKQKRDGFNLNIRPGVSKTSFSVTSPFWNADFGSKTNFRFGLEAEFVLPFNNGALAIIFEPTYQSFKAQTVIDGKVTIADYKSVELPLGIRRYFFINTKSKIFLNALIIFDQAFKSTVSDGDENQYEIYPKPNLGFGAGYRYSKYNVELRLHTNRNILSNDKLLTPKYNTVSFIVGYQIF